MTNRHIWQGASGTEYEYSIFHPRHTKWPSDAGNYIFARELSNGNWQPLYIGQTDNFGERIPGHEKEACALAGGYTHIHAHPNKDEDQRIREEADLIRHFKPTCNTQGT